MASQVWLFGGLALLACVACGGVVQTTGSSGSGGATSAAGQTTTGTTGSPQSSATGPATNGSSSSATTGSGGAAPGIVSAYGYSGGLDHLAIFEADPVRDLCFYFFADAPSSPTLGITFPSSWGGYNAGVAEGAATCTPTTLGTGSALATSATGSVTFTPPMGCTSCVPTSIDSVAVTLYFAPTAPWVPTSQTIQATNLIVSAWP